MPAPVSYVISLGSCRALFDNATTSAQTTTSAKPHLAGPITATIQDRLWRICGALPRPRGQMDPRGASQRLSKRRSVFSRTIS